MSLGATEAIINEVIFNSLSEKNVMNLHLGIEQDWASNSSVRAFPLLTVVTSLEVF